MTIDGDLIKDFFATTPLWVYPLVFIIIYMLLLSTRPVIIPVKRLLFMPVIFFSLSFYVIINQVPLNSLNIAAWIGGLLAGTISGWYQLRALRAKAIKNSKSLYVPGTWGLFIILMLLILLKHYAGYKLAGLDPQLLKNPIYTPWFMFLFGILGGLFVGRVGHAFYRVKYGPFIELTASEILRHRPDMRGHTFF